MSWRWMVLAALWTGTACGQSYSFETWPEIDLRYRLDERTTLIGLADYTRNRDSGGVYQAEAGAAIDHRFAPFFSGRLGYRHGWATDGGAFFEDRLLAEQTFRLFLPSAVTVDFRTREDFRWLNSGYSMRFRERVQVQRDTTVFGYTFSPYLSAELYYDTRYAQFSRYRLIAGSSFPLGKHVAVEPYYAHQVDVAGSSAIVDALGFVLTLSF